MVVKEDDPIFACFLIFLINVLYIKKYNVPKFQPLNKSPTKDFFIVITMQVIYGSIYFTLHRHPSILEFCGIKLGY
jgi:hypothetical protein